MNFDDRLKHELQNQGAQISVEPTGVDDISNRSAKRRQRRMAGMTAVVAVVLLGIGGFIANSDRGGTPVATDINTEADEDQTDELPESVEEPAEVIDGQPLAGSPLDFVDVSSGSSPGGFGVFGTGVVTSDAYYMLSTAPGKPADDDYQAFRPNTLYRFDGTTWTNTSFDDRFITSLSSDGDVLYTVSTGTKTSDNPAVGSSTDGGESWQWTPIDLTEQFGDDPAAWVGVNIVSSSADGSTFVIVHDSPGPDWVEGIEFAMAAGLDIDESDEVIDLTIEGIRWVPGQFELSPCAAEIDSYLEANLPAEVEALEEEMTAIYNSVGSEDEFSDEQMARLEAINEQLRNIYDQNWADAIASLRTSGTGCEAHADCLDSERTFNERWSTIEEGDPAGVDYEAIEQEYQDWLDNSGCGEVLGYQDDEFSDDEIETATWAELGVEVPASWYGSTVGYLVADGQSRALGTVGPDETGWLESVEYDGSTFRVVFNGVWGPEDEAGSAFPESTVYSSNDGATWTTSTRPFGIPRIPVNGMTFAIDWSEEQSSIVRSGPNGSERLSLEDLAPNIDTAGYFAERVYVGDYGVVITASRWQEFETANPVDSIVLYSPDGLSFGATPLPGLSAHSVMVGSNGVIVFSNDPSLANSDTPQPVWFGTAQ